jgi:excisionase family DNA binding protein
MYANDPTGLKTETRRRRERHHPTQCKPCGMRDDVRVTRSQPNKSSSLSEPPFTVAGFADFMGVVPKTVRKWIEVKKLEAFRDGRIIRITPAAARKFIQKNIK